MESHIKRIGDVMISASGLPFVIADACDGEVVIIAAEHDGESVDFLLSHARYTRFQRRRYRRRNHRSRIERREQFDKKITKDDLPNST